MNPQPHFRVTGSLTNQSSWIEAFAPPRERISQSPHPLGGIIGGDKRHREVRSTRETCSFRKRPCIAVHDFYAIPHKGHQKPIATPSARHVEHPLPFAEINAAKQCTQPEGGISFTRRPRHPKIPPRRNGEMRATCTESLCDRCGHGYVRLSCRQPRPRFEFAAIRPLNRNPP